jgi:4-hydroxy-tetrahydrodipicolinate reductase
MIRCAVAGACGRMGRAVICAVTQAEGIELVGATEQHGHPGIGSDAGELPGTGTARITVVDSLALITPQPDVIIDFTAPESSLAHMEWAASRGTAAVIGTTGFSSGQTGSIKDLARAIPCVCSPNMSVGINLMFTLIERVARILKDRYDMEIIESHHRLKKDAPSGTAVKMAHILAEAMHRDLESVAVHQRKGLVGARRRDEIGIQVVRAGDIVGDHTVLFAGEGERLEITHRAHSRDTFAAGAVRAAAWVTGQPPGLYDMLDVLGLSSSRPGEPG